MKILFQGDSITDAGRNKSVDGWDSLGQGYPLLVAADLGCRCPGKYEFENRGISGNRVVDIYQRIKCDFWNLKPDVLSLLIGVNDVWHELNGNGVEADRFENVYRMLMQDTLKVLPNIKIMLLEPFVLKAPATEENWDYFKPEVTKRADIVRKISKEFGTVFVPLQDKLDEAEKICGASYYLRDGVHPTPAGHRIIADEWIKAFEIKV